MMRRKRVNWEIAKSGKLNVEDAAVDLMGSSKTDYKLRHKTTINEMFGGGQLL